MRSEASAFLGLDIGGQSVKGFRLEADGSVSLRCSRPTPTKAGSAAVLSVVGEVVAELGRAGVAAAVGVGTPGAVDASGRVAGEAVNIPGWRGTELRAAVERLSGAPTIVRNDGNLAAFAEWAARAGAARALLFVGLGTGIGGGFIEDGRILSGIDDRAVEIGHVVVQPGGRKCACGRLGCVETYASGPSIGRIAAELASEPGRDSPLARAIRDAGGRADARLVYDFFARGDDLAREVHAQAARALAMAVAAAMALLAPDLVVLGGGVLAGAGAFVQDVAALVPDFVYDAAHRDCRFEKAVLGPEAGLLGAALFGAQAVLDRGELTRLAVAAAASLAVTPSRS